MNYHVQHSFTRPSYESLRIAQIEQEQRARSALNSITDPYERLQEKRRQYACTGSRYVTFLDIPSLDATAFPQRPPHPPNSPNTNVNFRNKISLFQGDITTLEVDAIVNAANSSLLGGGGIDGAIHIAAGVLLREECAPLKGCPTGYTKITLGCRLPAHYVLHTVGPDDGNPDALRHCYLTLLDHVVASHDQPQPASRVSSISTTSPSFQVSHYYAPPPPPTPYSPTTFRYHRSIRTLAICAIAVGIYGFPLEEATHIALGTIRKWLNVHHSLVDRIVFVVSEERVKVAYETLLPAYF